jgi:hypothetical protein
MGVKRVSVQGSEVQGSEVQRFRVQRFRVGGVQGSGFGYLKFIENLNPER